MNRRQVNIGGAGPLIAAPRALDLSVALAQGQGTPQAAPPTEQVNPNTVRRMAMLDALEGGATRPLEGGTWGEALARGLESYLHTRGARDERAREEQERVETRNRETARRSAMASALAAYEGAGDDPAAQQRAVIAALSQGAPDEALGMATGRIGQRMELADALGAERDRTPILAERARELGDIQTEQEVERARRMLPYARSGGGGVPQGYGNIPSGWRLRADGSLEPIPGGPADMRVTREQQQRAGAALSRLQNADNVMRAISRARELAGNGETGLLGSIMSGLPGTRAHNLDATLDIIRANIGFDALQEMRQNSPTGGALGQVTERELAFLQSLLDSVRQSQTREQFLQALNNLERNYTQSMARVRDAYMQDFGPLIQEAPAAAPQTQEQGGGRVRQYNPATGRIE